MQTMWFTLEIFWDPSPVAFRLPVLGYPIAWYGVLFALGFWLGCLATRRVVRRMLKDLSLSQDEQQLKSLAASFTDRLLWFTVVGTVVGARLGHVLFYDFAWYLHHPLQILQVWNGGLASHGAVVGVLLSLIAFRLLLKKPFPKFSLLQLLDIAVIPAALIGSFIRVGNFVNQEIVGRPADLPWAVFFGHPYDGSVPLARHPVQLYEAFSYLIIFLLLFQLAKLPDLRRLRGLNTGVFFLLVFGARFWLEFFKERQPSLLGESSTLLMGQLLSLPLIAFGAVLIGLCLYRAIVSKSAP